MATWLVRIKKGMGTKPLDADTVKLYLHWGPNDQEISSSLAAWLERSSNPSISILSF